MSLTARQHLEDEEIRDAAIQAVEHWQEPALLDVLKNHREEEPWLREYQTGVIRDLEENER